MVSTGVHPKMTLTVDTNNISCCQKHMTNYQSSDPNVSELKQTVRYWSAAGRAAFHKTNVGLLMVVELNKMHFKFTRKKLDRLHFGCTRKLV